MSKQEHIDYWKSEAEKNWETALYLLKGNQFVMSLFMFHLTLRNYLKLIG
jgi:hypothetical protein